MKYIILLLYAYVLQILFAIYYPLLSVNVLLFNAVNLFYKKKQLFISTVIIAVLLLSIIISNQNISGDTSAYIKVYSNLIDISTVLEVSKRYSASTEPVFWYLSYFIHFISNGDSTIYLFIICVIPMLIIMYVSMQIVPKYWAVGFAWYCSSIYYFASFGNTPRQALAASFLLLGLYYLSINKKLYGVIMFIIASLSHVTAVVFLPIILFIKYVPLRVDKLVFLLISCTLSGIIIFDYANYILGFIFEKAHLYAAKDISPISIISLDFMRFYMVIFWVLYIRQIKNVKMNLLVTITFKFYIVIYSFQLFIMSNALYWSRYSEYRMIIESILYSYIISNIKQKRIIICILIVLLIPYQFYSIKLISSWQSNYILNDMIFKPLLMYNIFN
jgi:hypothetical protein